MQQDMHWTSSTSSGNTMVEQPHSKAAPAKRCHSAAWAQQDENEGETMGFPPPPPFEMHGCIYPRMHTHARVSTAQHQRSENLARGGKKPWTHVSFPLKSITIPSEKGILVVAVSHWKSLVEDVKRNRLFAREVAAKWGRCVLLERAEVGAALRLGLENGVVCWARGICCKQPEPTP